MQTLSGSSAFGGGAGTMKLGRVLQLTAVVMWLALALFVGLVKPVSAGSVAPHSAPELVRCTTNYTLSGININVKQKCYFDPSLTWGSVAGTRVSATCMITCTPNISADIPTFASCTPISGAIPISMDIGPRAASLTQSGVALSAYQMEVSYTYHGSGACSSGYYDPTTAVGFQAYNIGTPHSGKIVPYSGDGQTVSMMPGWPSSFPTDNFLTGSAGATGPCPGFTFIAPNLGVVHYSPDTISFPWTADYSAGFISATLRLKSAVGSYGAMEMVSAGTIATSGTFSFAWKYADNGSTLGSVNAEIDCYSNVGGSFSHTYLLLTGSFTSTAAAIRGCDSASVSWPAERTYSAGELLLIRVTTGPVYGGAYSINLIQSAQVNPDATTGAAFTWANATFVRDSSGATISVTATNIAAGYTGFIGITASYNGMHLDDFRLRCTNTDGTYKTSDQWNYKAAAVDLIDDSGEPAVCRDVPGLGLNPSSWVPGLVGRIKCLGWELAVPRDEATQELYSSFSELSSKAPISYLTEGVSVVHDVVTGAPAAISGNHAGPITLLGEGPSIGGVPVWSAQNGAAADIGVTGTPTWRTIEGYVFWVGVCITFVMITRRVFVVS